ncbi:MAG TPA: hypothetical protein VGO11_14675 [Chthoniobacteraceae bacterium]|jgi:hypothetical protein|nr:hypothetical protein [Chthoniobacteraceae bacterium]
MKLDKVTCKFTKEELNHASVELIHVASLNGVYKFESWTHPDGDEIFVCVLAGGSFERDTARGYSTALNLQHVCFPQSIADLIERHPDQSVAQFRICSPQQN